MSLGIMAMVAVAGGAGAAARYTLDYFIVQRMRGVLPLGTWTVNITGSLALGLLVGLMLRLEMPPEVKIILGGGFLGAYTTFSTWMYESIRLMEQGSWRLAAVNVLGSLVTGLVAAALGLALAASLV